MYAYDPTLPISITAWLALDEYVPKYDLISASMMCKSIRKNILSERARDAGKIPKRILEEQLSSRAGAATHSDIERVWCEGKYKETLAKCGIPMKSIERIVVNPTGEVSPDLIPVYTELACETHVGDGWYVGGTADMVFDGQLQDFKQTKTYSYNDEGKHMAYRIQGSIYRAAMPHIVTKDQAVFIELYTDWMKGKTFQKDYPPRRINLVNVTLMSIPETKRFALKFCKDYDHYYDKPDSEIPLCTDEDLWRTAGVWQYFSKAGNKRATSSHATQSEAMRVLKKNGTGFVSEKKNKARACHWCDALAICGQAASMIEKGEL